MPTVLSHPSARGILHCLTLSAVLLFFICSAATLVAWLCLHPRPPAFRVDSLSVSGFNLSASQLTAEYRVQLNVTNPSRNIDLLIDHFDLRVVYRGVTLSRMTRDFSAHFRILRNRGSGVELEGEADGPNDKTRRRIVGDLGGDWSRGVITFGMKMAIRVKFRAGGWLTKQKLLSVKCKNLNVEFVSDNRKDTGELHGGQNTYCTVDFD